MDTLGQHQFDYQGDQLFTVLKEHLNEVYTVLGVISFFESPH